MTPSDEELIAKLLKKFREESPSLLVALYGKDLADSRAVHVLETYWKNTWSLGGSFPVRVPVVDFFWKEKFPDPFGSAGSALSNVRDAMERQDAGFFEDLAKALRRRKHPAKAARFKLIDFVQNQLDDLAARKRGPITNDELNALGINPTQTALGLGLDGCFKNHENRRGRRQKPKNKI